MRPSCMSCEVGRHELDPLWLQEVPPLDFLLSSAPEAWKLATTVRHRQVDVPRDSFPSPHTFITFSIPVMKCVQSLF